MTTVGGWRGRPEWSQAGMEEASADDPLRDSVRSEQVRLLYADGGVGRVMTVAVAVLLSALLIWEKTLGVLPAAIFVAALSLQAFLRVQACRAWRRAEITPQSWRTWADRDVAIGVLGGVIWGAAMPWLLAPHHPELQATVIVILVGGTHSFVGANGAYRPSLYTFFLPFPTVVVWLFLQGDLVHIVWGAILLLWLPGVALLGERFHASLTEALVLRFRNAALADDLRIQKLKAEQSDGAKSRFLAAASHDLRQPVHALGMFVGALRRHPMPARQAELVDHIDASVAALDGLFTSLLDISRLDAAAVQSRPSDIAVQPLLDRVRRDLAAEAEARGIDLILAPTRLAVRSDPLLLERVMRNLIGNAVRYTERGAVLVGCRRRGAEIVLEVWDTGPGIAPDHREAVFEEFFQVGNPDRDRSKGLGLGLPIVRRLTDILGHGLEMRSEVGRGTVFRVSAPRAAAAAAAVDLAERVQAPPTTGLVLAVDDDRAIRAAMGELLASWGHRVIAVGDGAAALRAVDEGARPDLIICDLRLRHGESGIAVIGALCERLGGEIPAILLTGDTAPETLRLAMASGYPLLNKPLAHVRLRAAVSSLTRRPKAAPAG